MSGWYPDPTGRHELRYHNGQFWTGDVARGGQRFVDPSPIDPSPIEAPRRDRNGLAVAGMVCGITAVTIGWVPFIAFLALVTAVVAVALSIVGLRRAGRADGGRRGFAVAGIITGSLGVVASAVGIVLTVLLVQLFIAYDDPGPLDASVTDCRADDDDVVVTVAVRNLSDDERSYAVLVDVERDADDRRLRITVDDVAAGATGSGSTSRRLDGTGGQPDCAIVRVDGPLPLGFDPEEVD